MGRQLTCTLLLLLLITSVTATDYYIKPDGSDTLAGTSLATAWKTLAKCTSTAQGGDRCLIQPGTYQGQAGAAIANDGSLVTGSPFSHSCTFTEGSKTVTCSSVNSISQGNWIRAADSHTYFSWTRVASISGTTIQLEEGYRGPSATNAAVHVAKFIEIVGQGTPQNILFTNWFDPPQTITWTQDSTYPDVWYYDPTTITGNSDAAKAWRGKFCSTWPQNVPCTSNADCTGGTCQLMIKGMRDLNTKWDTYYLPINNGREGYFRLGSSTNDVCYGSCSGNGHLLCPAGDRPSDPAGHRFNAASVPGAFTFDTGANGKVYVHTRKQCVGGARQGYNCLQNADCPASTCGASPNPNTLQMQAALFTPQVDDQQHATNVILDGRSNFVVVRNLTIEGGFHDTAGSGAAMQQSLYVGGSNALYSNINVWQGQVGWSMTNNGAIARAQFEHIDALSGSYCSDSGDAALSGVKWYDVEMRGTNNQIFNCGNGFRGASKTDRVIFDRLYAHRNYPGLFGDGDSNGQACAQAVTWDSTNEKVIGGWDWHPGHGVFWGTIQGAMPICNVRVQNSLFEMTGGNADSDALGIFGVASPTDPTCNDNEVFYNTFIDQNNPNRVLGMQIGNRNGTTAKVKSYGNLFITQWSSAQSSATVQRFNDAKPTDVTADYNAFVYPQWDNNGGGTGFDSSRIWMAYETLSVVITNWSQEQHSFMSCKDGCAGKTPGTHYNSPNYYVLDAVVTDLDPSDPTPVAGSPLVNAGAPNNIVQCPSEDFYGNPRDGACDIGAVEYQSGGSCTPKTCAELGANCGTPSDGCGNQLNCGTCPTGQTCQWNNVCAGSCTPGTCNSLGYNCGTANDGCGGSLNCGTCPTGQTCNNNHCGTTGCTPTTCTALGYNCGTASDGCGGTLNCGSCTGSQTCSNNVCTGSTSNVTSYKFDMDNPSSVNTKAGWTSVTNQLYNGDTQLWGWTGGMSYGSPGNADAVYADYHLRQYPNAENTFSANIANGQYNVTTYHYYTPAGLPGTMTVDIYAEGALVADNYAVNANIAKKNTIQTTVQDGVLNLRFVEDGSGDMIAINGIEIVPSSTTSATCGDNQCTASSESLSTCAQDCPCPGVAQSGDLDCNGKTDIFDLTLVGSTYGADVTSNSAQKTHKANQCNKDNTIGLQDLNCVTAKIS